MKSLVSIALLTALACGSTKTSDRAPRGSAKGATVEATRPNGSPLEREYAELRRLASTVTSAQRDRVKAEDDALWKAYESVAPKPRVVFEVPARECCPSPDQACDDRHLRFAGLCYENPTRELWGLGAFAIDDQGVFWIHDPVVDRAVGFDRSGKVVDAVPLSGPIAPTETLVVTPTEVWLDSFIAEGDPSAAYLTRVDRKTHQARTYHWQDLIGRENQGYGWPMPETPWRIARWDSRAHWDVVDVSFLDDSRMQISPPHPLHARGHRYWLDCPDERQPATLVIDDHAVAVPSCVQAQYVGPDGDVVAADPFYHYDVRGNVLAIASRTSTHFETLRSGNDYAVGPDGNAYQYVPGKKSVKFVQLPWFSKPR